MDAATPFMYKGGEGVNAGVGEVEWVVAKERWRLEQSFLISFCRLQCVYFNRRYKYDSMFDALSPIDGKVTGAAAKGEEQFLFGNLSGIFV